MNIRHNCDNNVAAYFGGHSVHCAQISNGCWGTRNHSPKPTFRAVVFINCKFNEDANYCDGRRRTCEVDEGELAVSGHAEFLVILVVNLAVDVQR